MLVGIKMIGDWPRIKPLRTQSSITMRRSLHTSMTSKGFEHESLVFSWFKIARPLWHSVLVNLLLTSRLISNIQ